MEERKLEPHAAEYELLQAVLDALPESVALLDADGTIRLVNRAWRAFADQNHLRSPDYTLGTNYLAVCANANGSHESQASRTGDALLELIHGQRTEFRCEYPCHGPGVERWFELRAVRLTCDPPRVIILHRNVTESVCARREIEKRFATLTDRELEVLALLVNGRSNKQVAGELFIGLRTAEGHRRNIMQKTQTDSLAELAQLAALGGIVAAEAAAALSRSAD